MKQESLASLMDSRNDVTSSVGSQGQATAAAGGLQGQAPGHLHRVQNGRPRGQSGPAGLRRLDGLHRPGREDAARRDAVRRNAAAGVQTRLPAEAGTAPQAGGICSVGGCGTTVIGKPIDRTGTHTTARGEPTWRRGRHSNSAMNQAALKRQGRRKKTRNRQLPAMEIHAGSTQPS